MFKYRPGMHFDNYVRIVEDNMEGEGLGVMRQLLNSLKLFIFETAAHISLPETYSEELRGWYREHLHMPFPIIAIEDPASVVIFKRVGSNDSALPLKQLNLLYNAWIPLIADASARRIPESVVLDNPEIDPISGISVSGIVNSLKFCDEKSMLVSGEVFGAHVISKGKHVGTYNSKDLQTDYQTTLLSEAKVAIEQLMQIVSPEHFILEESPATPPKRRKLKRPLFASERSQFRILKPHTIRKRMQLPEPQDGGPKKRGHDVRAHPRKLVHERYTKMRNKTIIIPAHWRGPKENTVGNRRYLVRIDL